MYAHFYIIYYNVLLLAVIIECILMFSLNNGNTLKKKNNSYFGVLLVLVIFSIILGYRPGSINFGDTALYQRVYEEGGFMNAEEPIWDAIGSICRSIGLSTGLYLSLIAFLYAFLPFLFLERYSNNKWFSLLMILSSFSFLGYGINGIRNGLALSILTYSFLFIDPKGKVQWMKILVCFTIAMGIHKSSLLPISGIILSLLIVKEIKTAVLIWLFCIPISLLGSSVIAPLFLNLGFDDRLDEYLLGVFKTGFRWDFILYSCVPILLAYYIIYVKKIVVEQLYKVLINTYILSNAMWIIIIEAAFSNRFAYLSWFMYPIVVAYPLLRYRIWHNQKTKVATFLFLYYLFTYMMSLKTGQ